MFILQRFRRFRILSVLAFAAISILFLSSGAASGAASIPPGLGKSFDEVVKLATKEGVVRIASSLTAKEVKLVLDPFYKRYPQIKVEDTYITGIDQGEKIFTEVLGGHVAYDVVKVVTELQSRFLKAGIVYGPFEWKRFFPKLPNSNIDPDGYFVGTSFSPRVIGYNPKLVPVERVPRKWEDCLDPYWKGKFILDPRPHTIVSLYHAWGEQRILDFARKIKENNPTWIRSPENSLIQISSGEYSMVAGCGIDAIKRMLQDPQANIAIAWPSEVPVRLNEMLGILKGAKNPNAAFLLSVWLASPEGQVGYDKVGRGSPFLEGTEIWKEFKKSGAKPIFAGWDEGDYNPPLTDKVVAIWGFPTVK